MKADYSSQRLIEQGRARREDAAGHPARPLLGEAQHCLLQVAIGGALLVLFQVLDLLFRLSHRASVLTRLGRLPDADAHWKRVLKIAPEAQRYGVRLQRAESRARAGDYRRSVAEAEELADAWLVLPPPSTALPASRPATPPAPPAICPPLPEREKNAEVWSGLALDLLRRAQRAGFFKDPKNVAALQQDEDLAYLRNRDDGKRFLAGLKSPR
jgi:hypothetical protein